MAVPPDTAIYDPLILRNIGRLVLSCIEAEFLQVNACKYSFYSIHFFEFYEISELLHRSKLKHLASAYNIFD